jgi:hypothetical protein
MIQLKDLDMEMTEVLDSELGLVNGGNLLFDNNNMWQSNEIVQPINSSSNFPTNTNSSGIDVSYNGNTKSLFNPSELSATYTSGSTTYGATGNGTFSLNTPTGNSSALNTSWNPWTGNASVKFGWKF